MSTENENSNTDNLTTYLKTKFVWYNMNPNTVIKRYNLSPEEGLELYSNFVKDQRLLCSTVIDRNSIYMEKMADIALFLGWIINLISIIAPVTDANISDSVIILLAGVGNLVAVILSTIVKYLSIDDKIQLFKFMEISFHRLYDKIEFQMARVHNVSEDENRTEQEKFCLQIYNKINEIRTTCPFVIPKSMLEYHYNQDYIIQLNNIAINELAASLMKRRLKDEDMSIEITD
jgi:hypothetical protein